MSEQAARDQNHVTSMLFVGSDGGTYNATGDEITGRLNVDMIGGVGTVTSVSVVSANGLAGTVATATTTPAITLSTTVTGVLKGNGTAISAAVAGTDYVAPGAVTTSGLTMTTARLLGRTTASTGAVEEITVGSGLSLAAGSLTATGVAGSVVVGTTTITSGTNTRVLYDNSGVLGEYAITGTGNVVMSNSPTFLDDITIGTQGTATGSILLNGTTSGTVTLKTADAAGTWTMTLPTNDGDSGQVLSTDGAGVTSWVSAGGVPTTITVANEATDTTCFVAFFTAATGDLGPKTNANMTFNSNTGVVTFASSVLTTTDINGGTIDGVTIGGASAGAITGTTITANTGFMPDANDGAYLGQAGTAFSDLFLAEGGVINWDSGDATLTQTGNVLALAGADLRVATADVGTNADSVPTLSSTSTFTNKTLTSPTINTATIGGITQLAEGASISLDAALSADGQYSGISIAGTAGATLAFGDLVYLAVADSRWELADADAATTSDRMLGMCVLAAASDGSATRILLMGNIRADAAFPALTVGAAAYVGETAGDIQVAIPTGADNVIRRVGYALTADELYFNPSMDSQITVA